MVSRSPLWDVCQAAATTSLPLDFEGRERHNALDKYLSWVFVTVVGFLQLVDLHVALHFDKEEQLVYFYLEDVRCTLK